MAGNISLTNMVILGLVGTFVITTLFGVYSNFVVLNGITIDEKYNTAFQEIALQSTEFETLADSASDKGLVTNILNFGSGLVPNIINVFVVGLAAIGKFFKLSELTENIFNYVDTAIPGFAGILGLFTIIITLYIAMRYIQTVTNKSDLP